MAITAMCKFKVGDRLIHVNDGDGSEVVKIDNGHYYLKTIYNPVGHFFNIGETYIYTFLFTEKYWKLDENSIIDRLLEKYSK